MLTTELGHRDAQETSFSPSIPHQRPWPIVWLSLSWVTYPAHYTCTCGPILSPLDEAFWLGPEGIHGGIHGLIETLGIYTLRHLGSGPSFASDLLCALGLRGLFLDLSSITYIRVHQTIAWRSSLAHHLFFVHKVVLKHSYIHLFPYCLGCFHDASERTAPWMLNWRTSQKLPATNLATLRSTFCSRL